MPVASANDCNYIPFWRIKLMACHGKIVLVQEMTVWVKDSADDPYQKVAWKEEKFSKFQGSSSDVPSEGQYIIKRANEGANEGGNDAVKAEVDAIHFNGGYLDCMSHSLERFVDTLDNSTTNRLRGRSVPSYGTNVAIKVDLALDEATFKEDGTKGWPIFFLQQKKPGPYVALFEKEKNKVRDIGWHISGQELDSDSTSQYWPESPGFKLEMDSPWHDLRVLQEPPGGRNDECRFRHMVDSLFLTEVNSAACEHDFDPSGFRFLIGGIPFNQSDQIAPIDESGVGVAPLKGKIRSLVIDPNDSCGTCFVAGAKTAGPTVEQ